MPIQSPLLQFKQLGCTRDGRELFRGIDFQIDAGDIVHIQGPNGIGKTTLLRALTGLLPDYEGDILWQGESISHVRYAFLSQLLFLGHLTGVKQTLTPRENLQFLGNLNTQCHLEHIDHALAQVGLYGYEEMAGYQLSAGQHRRIALARLYLSEALVWVLDEPYTALDAEGVDRLETVFNAHINKGGCVILTSHQSPHVEGLRYLSLLDYAVAPQTTQGIEEGDNV